MLLDRHTYFSVLDAALLDAGNLVVFDVVANVGCRHAWPFQLSYTRSLSGRFQRGADL